jgi:hypothetical protein
MTSAIDSLNEIATLRIELLDTDPVIWRQVEVPTSITLKGLHDVVQAAMGWYDQHLWELRQGRQRYGQSIPGDDWGGSPTIQADKVRLREILKPKKTVLDYVYDFGDSWEHRLTFTDVRSGDPQLEYPRYIAGERAAPPEDCGGTPGFYGALDVLADPKHPDHAEIADWFDGYDPDVVDELVLTIALSRIARRRNSAKATVARKAKA